jgi:hypothetical protein
VQEQYASSNSIIEEHWWLKPIKVKDFMVRIKDVVSFDLSIQ